ncbi:hypothetical protein F5146DRAFT_1006037 [Armillaria mellea]|nr:hypothetical protein F5146DRAFT_1006037 [Armillaria mellea]
MDTLVDPLPQCSSGLKCTLCHHILDFVSTIDHRTLDGKTFVFGNVWSLECGHLVDSDYSEGNVKAMVPYAAMYQFLRPLALQFLVPVHGTLGDLECLGLKLQSLHQGIRGRLWPTSAPITVEYTTNQSITHFPPIVVSISSTIASLSGSVENGYLIDALVAETLANHPPTPQWPSHLDLFRDSLDILDVYNHNLVLVAPGLKSLNPEGRFKNLDWVLPQNQPI